MAVSYVCTMTEQIPTRMADCGKNLVSPQMSACSATELGSLASGPSNDQSLVTADMQEA